MKPSPLSVGSVCLALIVAACSSTALMDGKDDMAGPNNGQGATVGGECSACFDTVCAWEKTECAGDPGCAQWLQDAQACAPDGQLRPDPTCVSAGLPGSSSGRSLANALSRCLSGASTCCTGVDNEIPGSVGDEAGMGPAPGSGGDYNGGSGGGASAGSGGGAQTGADAGDGIEDGDAGLCPGCSCQDCLAAVKHGEANDATCAQAVTSCWEPEGTNPCWKFATNYDYCAQSSDAALPAVCFGQLYTKPELAAGRGQFTSTVLPCAARYCAEQCWPEEEAACVTCQVQSCYDALAAFLADDDAQRFRWCRQICEGDTACTQACGQEFQAGLPVFQLLAQCTSASCSAECAGVL